MFFTKGVGRAKEKLTSFEAALRHAGIAPFNLVKVSSIYPPNCRIVSRSEGLNGLEPGTILYCVLSECATNEPNRLISAAVGLAMPADRSVYGYLSEHHSFGETGERSGEFAEDLAATMLASSLGIPFDPDQDYNARKDIFLMSKKVVKTRNTTQSARGHKAGMWTSVLAAAVFRTD